MCLRYRALICAVSLFRRRLALSLRIVVERVISPGRHAIFFIRPLAEIYQLAAFGTERTIRIVLPLDRVSAVRTLHRNQRGKMEKGKRERKNLIFLFLNLFPFSPLPLFPLKFFYAIKSISGRFIRIFRSMKSIVPSRRMTFKRTVTLSLVEPTMEAISRCGRGRSISTPPVFDTP